MYYAFEYYNAETTMGQNGQISGSLSSFLKIEDRDDWVAEGVNVFIPGIRVEPFRKAVTAETLPAGHSITDAFSHDHW